MYKTGQSSFHQWHIVRPLPSCPLCQGRTPCMRVELKSDKNRGWTLCTQKEDGMSDIVNKEVSWLYSVFILDMRKICLCFITLSRIVKLFTFKEQVLKRSALDTEIQVWYNLFVKKSCLKVPFQLLMAMDTTSCTTSLHILNFFKHTQFRILRGTRLDSLSSLWLFCNRLARQ